MKSESKSNFWSTPDCAYSTNVTFGHIVRQNSVFSESDEKSDSTTCAESCAGTFSASYTSGYSQLGTPHLTSLVYSPPAKTGSKHFSDCSHLTPLPLLQSSLMSCHRQKEPNEYYEILEVLGEGSMGNVYRIKKRAETIGGSARASFKRSVQEAIECPFATTDSRSSSQDIFQVFPDEDSPKSQKKDSYNNYSKLISNGHKDLVFALKTINHDEISSSDFIDELENEVEILKTLDHPNIVRLIEAFKSHDKLCIVEELCDGGDLYSRDPYTEQDAAKIVKSVCSAIAYMHSRNIIHRDIKYENIMFTSKDENADVKLIDFGLSKRYTSGSHLHELVGTVYTMAPELLRMDYTAGVDMWSMGVVSYMLLSSEMPFVGRDRNHVVQKITRGRYGFSGPRWNSISADARKFVSSLLKQNPQERPTAEQALKDPWLAQDIDLKKDSTVPVMDNVVASIQTFADYSRFKKLALMLVAYNYTTKEIGYLRQIFDDFAASEDSLMTLETFKRALEGYFYSDDELKRIFMGVDIDGSGNVHYSEFLAATIEAHGSINEEQLAEAFDRLDFSNSGYITVGDMRQILGEDIPTTFLEEVLDAVATDHSCEVSYDEFLAMWDHTVNENRLANQFQVQQKRTRWIQNTQLAQ